MCQGVQKSTMEELLQRIAVADDFEIQDIMRAVERRYKIAFPDWEVVYMAIHRDPKLKEKDLKGIIARIEKEKTVSLG